MRSHLPLGQLRAFEAAARHGSFKQAADELAVTPTAISHQIRTLEAHIATRLFDRRVRKVVLTEAGQLLYPVLRDGFDAFDAALGGLAQQNRRGRVTISATTAFTAHWLVPRIARFQQAHPGIELRLQSSEDVAALGAGGVDIAIRYGRGPYPGLAAEPLFADRFAPVASPRLRLGTPADLAQAPLIHFDWRRPDPGNPTWATWFAAAGLAEPAAAAALRFSDENLAIQAAVTGRGVALLSLALVAEEIADGALVQPFGPVLDGLTYHLVTTAPQPPEGAVAAAIAWLRGEAAAGR
ncbi:LysR family glycine cleavage system transcriptional activator [Sphingomonas zeicaulis]|uniref:LysR substrate-binding domain-containing protein n=1 Tax=Sphingomonas zeicaulis TaxID=1632740 RepID=UPI003D1D050E